MYLKKTKQESFDYSKKVLFETIPEAIIVFDDDDPAYFLFSEYTDYIIKNMDKPILIKKAISVLDTLFLRDDEVIEEMLVIQVFQKIYLATNVRDQFRSFLKGKCSNIYDKYLLEYNQSIKQHSSLDKYQDGRIVNIDE